jgi:chaperonin cofactor prefoldin
MHDIHATGAAGERLSSDRVMSGAGYAGGRLRPQQALTIHQSSADDSLSKKRKAFGDSDKPEGMKKRSGTNDEYSSVKAFMTNMVTVEGQLAANPGMTQEEAKFEAKKEYHRQHAAICRTRNRSLVTDLQQRVDDLSTKIEHLEESNQALLRENAALRAENQGLRSLRPRTEFSMGSGDRASMGLPAIHPFDAAVLRQQAHPFLSPAESYMLSNPRTAPSSSFASTAPLLLPPLLPSSSLGGMLSSNSSRNVNQGNAFAGSELSSQRLDAGVSYEDLLRLLLSRNSSNARAPGDQNGN